MTLSPLTVDELERWVAFGAQWRAVELGDERAVVELCQCTGELVERRETDDARVIGYLRLARFVDAQDRADTYEHALAELRAGHKRGHWMWFVFPQITGLGVSETSRRYAISSLDEATAYLAHTVLGPRLVESSEALLALPGDDPVAILGEIDAVKLRSSMTLFARVEDAPAVFTDVLARYFAGVADDATERLLGGS